ncbi:hypothetical protein [Acaryochloris sp. CCMEE 5410]|uniref:hypothetical protein n=1 Tax=Acaryochloris sp. CCMEE 5410 TaxID=310037 RepID=UPI0021D08C65|nr:hypothetical protein [Acaryochloris sp. CCMEE 5410]
MAYKRQGATLSMSKFREIIRLHELGHNNRRSLVAASSPVPVSGTICAVPRVNLSVMTS